MKSKGYMINTSFGILSTIFGKEIVLKSLWKSKILKNKYENFTGDRAIIIELIK